MFECKECSKECSDYVNETNPLVKPQKQLTVNHVSSQQPRALHFASPINPHQRHSTCSFRVEVDIVEHLHAHDSGCVTAWRIGHGGSNRYLQINVLCFRFLGAFLVQVIGPRIPTDLHCEADLAVFKRET